MNINTLFRFTKGLNPLKPNDVALKVNIKLTMPNSLILTMLIMGPFAKKPICVNQVYCVFITN